MHVKCALAGIALIHVYVRGSAANVITSVAGAWKVVGGGMKDRKRKGRGTD